MPRRRSRNSSAVEVIDLVLKRAREQARALDHALLAVAIERAHDRARRPRDGRVEAGQAQAAFFLELHAVALDELRD